MRNLGSNLLAEIVSDGLRLLGVDKVLVTRVQRLRLELGHLNEEFYKDNRPLICVLTVA